MPFIYVLFLLTIPITMMMETIFGFPKGVTEIASPLPLSLTGFIYFENIKHNMAIKAQTIQKIYTQRSITPPISCRHPSIVSTLLPPILTDFFFFLPMCHEPNGQQQIYFFCLTQKLVDWRYKSTLLFSLSSVSTEAFLERGGNLTSHLIQRIDEVSSPSTQVLKTSFAQLEEYSSTRVLKIP